ncbi:hypothetical protein FisN_25Lu067 [Fistulifera solaris]|uniref:Uncharacterized protein n=1 Tax=Fistulifera solaris TaxID=1519565 RepID=A0A1Z5JLH9_FISSO|nr:hypothetical protein FisN_25Lu067 [Fistulifera solaris]|eukprot:GAX14766.1 hypothetical protein FisN_25Lu067 [Fistulifera solaris]
MNRKKGPNRKRKHYFVTSATSSARHDLFVPLPSKPPIALQIRSISDRLQSVGYHSMALTHTVFGASQKHEAGQVIPDSWFPCNDSNSRTTLTKCQRRLHVVVESVSEVAFLFSSSTNSSWIQEYDLLSVAPRNAATFRQACLSSHTDIVTLDYASVRGGLPYSIGSNDLRALFARGAVLEIPYAAAILQQSLRPHFVQACRELELACLGVSRPYLLFSSGPTASTTTNSDSDPIDGELALHSYTDVLHMITTVTGLKDAWFQGAADAAIRHAHRRRGGRTPFDIAQRGSDPSRAVAKKVSKQGVKLNAETATINTIEESKETEEIEGEDGFISF